MNANWLLCLSQCPSLRTQLSWPGRGNKTAVKESSFGK